MVACAVFVGLAFLAFPLLRDRPHIPKPIQAVDEPEEFQLTPQFASENDRSVLLAVLDGLCKTKGRVVMLSDKPIERMDNRKQLGVAAFPTGISCDTVQVESSEKLSNAVSNCPEKSKPALSSETSWPCFNYHYPNARAILSLSMPFYYQENGIVASVKYGITCGWLCGSGFEYFLRKVDGKWKVVDTKPTWIA